MRANKKKALIALEQEIPAIQKNLEGQLRGGFVALTPSANPASGAGFQLICVKNTGCNVSCTTTTTTVPGPVIPPSPTTTTLPTTTTTTYIGGIWYASAGTSLLF